MHKVDVLVLHISCQSLELIIICLLVSIQYMDPNSSCKFLKSLSVFVGKFLKCMIIVSQMQKSELLYIFEMFVDCKFIDSLSADTGTSIIPKYIKQFLLIWVRSSMGE